MFVYEKRLQYPVNIKQPNPALAKIIISQYGGLHCKKIYINKQKTCRGSVLRQAFYQLIFVQYNKKTATLPDSRSL